MRLTSMHIQPQGGLKVITLVERTRQDNQPEQQHPAECIPQPSHTEQHSVLTADIFCSAFHNSLSQLHFHTHTHHKRFTALSGTTLVSRCHNKVQGMITEADTPTIRMGATPSGLTSAHLHHPPIFTGRMPFLPPNQQCQSTEGN